MISKAFIHQSGNRIDTHAGAIAAIVMGKD